MPRPVAVVTGSSAGIGAATALKFAESGYNVVINYSRDPAPALTVATACRKAGAEVETIKADVSQDADCRMMADMVGSAGVPRARWSTTPAGRNS